MKKISAMPTHAPADCHSAGEPDAIAEPGAGEQAARADPRREQREHEHVRRQRPAGDQEVVAASGTLARPPHADRRERDEIAEDRDRDTCAHSTRDRVARARVARRARSRARGTLAHRVHVARGPESRHGMLLRHGRSDRACRRARAGAARPRVLRAPPRPLHAVLHRDVGALQLLRHAGAADPVHDRAGGDRRPRLRHRGRRARSTASTPRWCT